MSSAIPGEAPAARIQRRKKALEEIRDRARRQLEEGSRGLQIASMLSDAVDRFTIRIYEETLSEFTPEERQQISRHSAMVAIGGSGRGEVAPYSDADLLFLFRPQISNLFSRFSKRFVPEFWDAGIEPGQRVLTVRETTSLALIDPHLASSLVHVRHLWGDSTLVEQLTRRFYRGVVRRRMRAFIEQCIEGRVEERDQFGGTATPLEPDVKRSPGGLRDLHLLNWIAYARYETTGIDNLWRLDVLTKEDAARLNAAVEFLTRIRIDLHLHARRANDLLTRDEQLRIAESRNVEHDEGRIAVECFMQEFFRHCDAIAGISRRFVALHRPLALSVVLRRAMVSQRVDRFFILRPEELDVSPANIPRVCRNLDDILRIYHAAAMYRVRLSPRLSEAVRQKALTLPPGPSLDASRLFLELLGTTGRLSETLRSMHDNGVLELIIPEWKRVRCLLQFNQYHHFTVDEHTLRCLEICESFADEDSPRGEAYRGLKHKELLHLALLLHDAGKGFVEEHSLVGQRLARDVCQRFRMPSSQADIVGYLILRHLRMADLAFRHDISDPRILLEFSHDVGTPEKLTMLYVLTIADVSGVGPGVWNHWKNELLHDFYDRLMLILSGQPPRFHEDERLRKIREHVYRSIVPLDSGEEDVRRWVDQQLDSFSAQYLTLTPPARIAADLDIIRSLRPGEIRVEGRYDPDARIVDYRIILDSEHSTGCFHLISGALAARGLEILGAEITTSRDNIVVDVFHVVDRDFSGEVPAGRIEEVGESIRSVLTRQISVENLFRRHRRYSSRPASESVMKLPTRVEIDNDTSDRCTVVSVFAHDQTGLLYTITRTLFQLGLSIELAKIATHFDQVADVFYVTDNSGRKIDDEARRDEIRQRMMDELIRFQESRHRDFET